MVYVDFTPEQLAHIQSLHMYTWQRVLFGGIGVTIAVPMIACHILLLMSLCNKQRLQYISSVIMVVTSILDVLQLLFHVYASVFVMMHANVDYAPIIAKSLFGTGWVGTISLNLYLTIHQCACTALARSPTATNTIESVSKVMLFIITLVILAHLIVSVIFDSGVGMVDNVDFFSYAIVPSPERKNIAVTHVYHWLHIYMIYIGSFGCLPFSIITMTYICVFKYLPKQHERSVLAQIIVTDIVMCFTCLVWHCEDYILDEDNKFAFAMTKLLYPLWNGVQALCYFVFRKSDGKQSASKKISFSTPTATASVAKRSKISMY